jgi:O-antigen ligase
LLLLFTVKLFRGSIKDIRLNDRTIIAILCLTTWSLLVSLFGSYPADSLNAMKRNLLIELLIFFVIITEFKSLQELKPLFLVVVSSFAIVTFVSLIESASADWTNFQEIVKTHKMFIGGYANNATFYLPFIAVLVLALNEASWKKWAGILTLLSGVVLIFLYNSRTALIAMILSLFIILMLSKRYKMLILYTIMTTLFFIFLYKSEYSTFTKYKSLVNYQTYITNEGTSKRFDVWQGALHIIEKRPIAGYGYGWKKMAWTIDDLKLKEYWKTKYPPIYEYYVKEARISYGRANPHNLALQILFEIGAVGLALFVWLWITVIQKMYKVIVSANDFEMHKFMLFSTGIIVSYFIINLTNGFWQETYGNMIFLFMALVFVIYRQHISELKLNGKTA